MKTRIVAILLIVFVCTKPNAQSRTGVYFIFNPLATLELQAAYSAGIGYQFNSQFDISSEYSFISKPLWTAEGKYANVKGWRNIVTARFTIDEDEWRQSKVFAAVEFRTKKLTYDDQADFTDASNNVIKDYTYRNKTFTTGIAGLIGKQVSLNESGTLMVEMTAGIGARNQSVTKENIPLNTSIVPKAAGFMEIPNTVNSAISAYFPMGVRLIVRL